MPNNVGNGGNGEARFTVQTFDFGGKKGLGTTVRLECEVLTATDGDDPFYIWFDDEAKYTWTAGTQQSFSWTPVGETFSLSAGIHTLHVGNAEDGAKLRTLRISYGDASFQVG